MARIRVLVVDDAVMMRRLISSVLESDPEIEVAGVAASGSIALQKIPQVNPDVITMDVEMPDMNGIETVRRIRQTWPRLPIIMFSSLTSKGAESTLDAMAAGATDYVAKPANMGSLQEGVEQLRRDVVPKIKAHFAPPVLAPRSRGLQGAPASAKPSTDTFFARRPPGRINILAIGTSTGGPNALADLFRHIPREFPVPIVIVQHMPPLFTEMLATRLNSLKSVRFHEGRAGQPIEPGNAFIAPGGRHMVLARRGASVVVELNDDPPENSCRPAVDVLFRSVTRIYGGATLGVILTGMGQDGLRGCRQVKEAGGQVLAQDEASSVVWGMPGYVAQEGLADKVLPLNQLAAEITRRVRHSQPALTAA